MAENNPIRLKSLDQIASACGVSKKRVKKWCRMTPPPPIAIEGEGAAMRYSAEYYTLNKWRTEVFAPKT